jgi:hypothetical protein
LTNNLATNSKEGIPAIVQKIQEALACHHVVSDGGTSCRPGSSDAESLLQHSSSIDFDNPIERAVGYSEMAGIRPAI